MSLNNGRPPDPAPYIPRPLYPLEYAWLYEPRYTPVPKFDIIDLTPLKEPIHERRSVDVWSAVHGRTTSPDGPPRPEAPHPQLSPRSLRPHELECINPAFYVEGALEQYPVGPDISDYYRNVYRPEDDLYLPTAALQRQLLKAVNHLPPRLPLPVPESASPSSLAPAKVRLEEAVVFSHPPRPTSSRWTGQRGTWPRADATWPRVVEGAAQRAFERQLQLWGPSLCARHIGAPGANFEFLDLATGGGYRAPRRAPSAQPGAANNSATSHPVDAQLQAMQALLARLVDVVTAPPPVVFPALNAPAVPPEFFVAEVAAQPREFEAFRAQERQASLAAVERLVQAAEAQQREHADHLRTLEARLRQNTAESLERQAVTLQQNFATQLRAQGAQLRSVGRNALRASTARLRSEAAAGRAADGAQMRAELAAQVARAVAPEARGPRRAVVAPVHQAARANRLDDSRLRRNLPPWLSRIAEEPFYVHLWRGAWGAPGWRNTLFAVPKASLSVMVWWLDKFAAVVAWLHASGMLSFMNMVLTIYLRSPRVA